MEQKILRTAYSIPSDREKMEAIINAVCLYYNIEEEALKFAGASKKMDITAIRRECFYLILTNTTLKDKTIAYRLDINRSSVSLAKGIIDTHKEIYQQTRNNLKAIAAIANTFDKTSEWHIQ